MERRGRCGLCGRPTGGRELFRERWMLCDGCATRAVRLAGKTECTDCGRPTYGVREGDVSYPICIGCLSSRQVEAGSIGESTAAMRRVLAETYEWNGRLGRFLDAVERLEAEGE